MRAIPMRAARTRQAGLSLLELMIAITIGLFLLVGLVSVFATSNQTYMDLSRAAQQIENGRFAVQLISDDVAHAGFYGRYPQPVTPVTIPVSLPNPCVNTVTGTPPTLLTAMVLPIQGYDAPAASPITACLPVANHVAYTDILVIRRADSTMSAGDAATIPGGALTLDNIYLQSNADSTIMPVIAKGIGTSAGDQAAFPLKNKDPNMYAAVRRYHVHIYFVAPCSVGTDTGGVCQAGDDSIPTLKRLELTSDGVMTVVPLVEGIEHFQVDYGIDTDKNSVPDSAYVTDPTCIPNCTPWTNVVAVRISVLARNLEPTSGYADTKKYDMGAMGTLSASDAGGTFRTDLPANYKRHVYNAVIRLVNPAARRES